jgi:hypothetical protein
MATRQALAIYAHRMQLLPLLDFHFHSHQSIPGARWGKDETWTSNYTNT